MFLPYIVCEVLFCDGYIKLNNFDPNVLNPRCKFLELF